MDRQRTVVARHQWVSLVRWRHLALPAVAGVATVVAHGFNMFRYPYYENDEATYLSQAWAVLHGQLAIYTYWYDHAPFGWILLAGWLRIFGIHAFGASVNSGRVAMLLLHVAAVLLTFRIARRATRSELLALVAALLVGLSPLGTYFMRQVLLDNIMLVWVLFAVDLLLGSERNLWSIIFSGVALGVAVLTKETAAVFVPVLVLMTFVLSPLWQRRFSVVMWAASCLGTISLYPLMALLKGELFPSGWILAASTPHASLFSTLVWQMGRTGHGILDVHKSLFWISFGRWWELDPFLLLAGIVATLGNLLLSVHSRSSRWVGLLSLALWAYLLRGGLVVDFYVTPLVPLLALNVVVLIREISGPWAPLVVQVIRADRPRVLLLRRISGNATIATALLGLFIAPYLWWESRNASAVPLYLANQTGVQEQAIAALKALPPGAVIAMDNFGFLDLRFPFQGVAHPNAHYYEKVVRDPAIRLGLLHNNPGNIDYILLTPSVTLATTLGEAELLNSALRDSVVIQSWGHDHYGLEILEVRTPQHILRYAWQSYVRHFITSDGRVQDPQQAGVTTSEGQAYAMLRAVWMDDRPTFNRVWNWSRSHLQTRADSLLVWRYGQSGPAPSGVLDTGTAADADEDAALALLFAGRTWHNPAYLAAGQLMVKDIWTTEVGYAGSKPYLVAGNWGTKPHSLVINPSYLAPYAYRIFAQVDAEHPWMSLVETSYRLLEADASNSWGVRSPLFLPTEWVGIDRRTGQLRDAEGIAGGGKSWFSFGAARVLWRVGLDYQWNREVRAAEFLQHFGFLLERVRSTGKLYATYAHDGTPIDQYESRAVIGAELPALMMLSAGGAEQVYRSKLFEGFYKDGDSYYWSDPKNYYEQNWAWFGTAQYAGLLPNIWTAEAGRVIRTQ